MLTELNGKGGSLCEGAKEGKIHCPLIVRPTSEDVVTGEIFQVLRAINPRVWLVEFLNRAMGTDRFRQQIFRNFRIELWKKQSKFPTHMLPWKEGHTEVDVIICWDNPKTIVFVEMKYLAPLSANTTHNHGTGKLPADQLIRNVRVGLHRCGWYREGQLFDQPKSDFAVVLLAPQPGNPLVTKYRDEAQLRRSLPRESQLPCLPRFPFIGELCYLDIIQVLHHRRRHLSPCERRLADQLSEYVEFKLRPARASERSTSQLSLPVTSM